MTPITRHLGEGQVALELDVSVDTPTEQLRDLVKISDPALSELGFEALLNELLVRVRDLLRVDTAAVLLLDQKSGELMARAAKGIEEEVEQGVRIPLGRGFAGRIAQERVAIFIADVDHADILNPILRAKGIRSLLGVPLIVEGDLIGVLHVGTLAPRTFDLRDLAVLELAAARAAPAIERARLLMALEQEHSNAVMLQRSLLPRRLDRVPGVTIAARYLPARDEVGGDWYDVIELPQGRVAVVIGDVVGHGLEAATLMGQLRTALHAYALDGHGPARSLELVDRFAKTIGPHAMATAAVALVDVDQETITYASAGHLPPVRVSPGAEPHLLEVTPAPPLGAFGYGECPEYELALRREDMMLLYTDGLIERPRIPIGTSLEQLLDSVRDAVTPEDACLLTMDRLVPERGPRDDVAVIALRLDPVPAELDVELDTDPLMLATMRRILNRWQNEHALSREAASEITIAVSEACANAIEHAYGPGQGTFRVRARHLDGSVEIRVSDRGAWRSPRGEHRGRGLKIMEAAMDRLDIRRADGGTEIVMRRDVSPNRARKVRGE